MRLVVMNHISLDCVMQGPGRPGEDERGGFVHSGWAAANSNDEIVGDRDQEIIGSVVAERLSESRGWLFGRRTYEDVLRYWNSVPNSAFAASLNGATKYVATTRPDEALKWPNSIPLGGVSVDGPEVPDAVRQLRADSEGVLGIMGSSVLLHALQRHGLIDEYVLMIHPIVLGTGLRLFPEHGNYQTLKLVEPVRTSPSGVIAAVFDCGT
jgi:dihydrofolate reductase